MSRNMGREPLPQSESAKRERFKRFIRDAVTKVGISNEALGMACKKSKTWAGNLRSGKPERLDEVVCLRLDEALGLTPGTCWGEYLKFRLPDEVWGYIARLHQQEKPAELSRAEWQLIVAVRMLEATMGSTERQPIAASALFRLLAACAQEDLHPGRRVLLDFRTRAPGEALGRALGHIAALPRAQLQDLAMGLYFQAVALSSACADARSTAPENT